MPTRGVNGMIAAISIVAALLYNPVRQRLTTVGVTRGEVENIHGVEGLRVIPGTTMCEDLHLEKTTNQLFAACQQAPEERVLWFPPLEIFIDHTATAGGTVVRIDPISMTSTTLKLKGFAGPMVTHGIDILNDPNDHDLLWIYAVNHLPNPERWDVKPPRADLPPERASIEVFSHRLGSDEAKHVRSVQHQAIRMPNDILAVTPTSFYVTNDHVNYEGISRAIEDIGTKSVAPIPDTVLVDFTDFTTKDPTAGVMATTALQAVHNNNGLGRGSVHHPEEVVIVDATGGVMVRATRSLSPSAIDRNLTIVEEIQAASTLDNPSYYEDPYATPTNNASGYILPGLSQAYKMVGDFPHLNRAIPSLVWHVRSNPTNAKSKKNAWEQRLIFHDDGKALRSASAAVLVGIDPKENQGRKMGWLFVTGFGSFNVVAAKINL